MNIVYLLPVVLIVFAFSTITGNMAKYYGRSFWIWFFISVPLPVISCFILVWFKHKQKQVIPVRNQVIPVGNQEIFLEMNGIR